MLSRQCRLPEVVLVGDPPHLLLFFCLFLVLIIIYLFICLFVIASSKKKNILREKIRPSIFRNILMVLLVGTVILSEKIVFVDAAGKASERVKVFEDCVCGSALMC